MLFWKLCNNFHANNSDVTMDIRKTLLTFFFGVMTGGFFAVAVVREAVPLRDHVWMIGLTLLFGAPILVMLGMWYFRLMETVKQAMGPKGGEVIGQILSFQLASFILFALIFIVILYAAVV